jgi:hypothetical protein
MNPEPRGQWTQHENINMKNGNVRDLVNEFLLLATESELLALVDKISEIGKSKVSQKDVSVDPSKQGEIYF